MDPYLEKWVEEFGREGILFENGRSQVHLRREARRGEVAVDVQQIPESNNTEGGYDEDTEGG